MRKEGNKVYLNEEEIKGIINECVRKVINEGYNQFSDGEGLGMTGFGEIDDNYDGMYRTKYGPVTITGSKGDFCVRGPKVREILGGDAQRIKNEIDKLIFGQGYAVEDAVSAAVGSFCDKYYRHGAVNEKFEKTFNSKEDMSQYRDMYAPDTENSGPFANHRKTIMDDGYDYCGDDMYNDEVDDYNSNMREKLATKGGQMNYDWGNRFDGIGTPNSVSMSNFRRGTMNKMQDKRNKDMERWHRMGEKKRNKWVKGKYDNDEIDLGMYDFEV